MKFIEASSEGDKDFSVVQPDSVVVLPAFGASIQEMTMLSDKKVQMVDTTCPWVSKVRCRCERTHDEDADGKHHGQMEIDGFG